MANGFSSAINAALSSMSDTSQKTIIKAGNIANSATPGYKAFQSIASSLITGSATSSSGVSSTVRQLIDQQGTPLPTGVSTDLSVQNSGFFVVQDGNGSYSLSRLGSFRKDNAGNFVDPTGIYTLQGWLLDANGQLPENKSLITSLAPVNINKLVSNAVATSKVSVGVNLNPSAKVVGGGSATMHISDTGSAASKYNYNILPSQTLYPNSLTNLTPGEGMQFSLGETKMQMIYGGFVQTLSLANAGTTLQGTATDEFNIQVGTSNLPAITRGTGANNLSVLQNIADQINTSNGSLSAVARVINDGTNSSLLIAPTNANLSLTFSGDSAFRNAIGVGDSKNILAFAETTGGEVIGRFASLQNLSDMLNTKKINSYLINKDSFGTNLTIDSDQVLSIANFNPKQAGSNFLAEFGINPGYLHTTYNPYDSANNMAGKTNKKFASAYTSDVTAFNPQGIGSNLLIGTLKVDTNKWAIEVFAADPSRVNVAGRTDGLLMAGIATFDGKGNLQALDGAAQNSQTIDFATPGQDLNATGGQTLTIATGNSVHTYTYGASTATSTLFSPSANTLVQGVAGNLTGDILTVTVDGVAHPFTRGNGVTNLEVLRDLEKNINDTSGASAITAAIVKDATSGNYRIIIRAANPSAAVSFSETGTGGLGTDIGITSANDIAKNSFKSLYELAQQINTSSGADGLTADVINGVEPDTFRLRVAPVNSSNYMTFGGTTAAIGSPLGNGASQTIASALSLKNTSALAKIPGLLDTMAINWADSVGASPNSITFDWGAIGSLNGLGQIAGDFSLKSIIQNGSTTGQLSNVLIDAAGYVNASFTNGQTKPIYKIALADVANPNGLQAQSSNVFSVTQSSGKLILKEPGKEGVGTINSGVLEGSNVDLAGELSDLIIAQRQYQASAKVLNVVDSLVQDLIQRTFN